MISADTVEQAIKFHGHMCPGLAVGLRAAEIALRDIGPHAQDEEVVAVVETDMCAVDGIQFMTGCTYGKGNLIHLDYGKNAFTFYRRSDGKAIRIVTRPEAWSDVLDEEHLALRRKLAAGTATAADQARFTELHQQRSQMILTRPLDTMFSVTELAQTQIPAKARIHESVLCAGCGETVMETRSRIFRGQAYCIPCFEVRDRRY